jgi:hypothetical protein
MLGGNGRHNTRLSPQFDESVVVRRYDFGETTLSRPVRSRSKA